MDKEKLLAIWLSTSGCDRFGAKNAPCILFYARQTAEELAGPRPWS